MNKLLSTISLSIFLSLCCFGCAHNEAMVGIEKERQSGYIESMKAWQEAVKSDPGKILEIELDGGKNLVVYNQNRHLPPMPMAPAEIKTWGAQIADSSSELGMTAIKWGAGLMAIKIVTDNAGHNDSSVNTSGSNNTSNASESTNTDNSVVDNSTSDSSSQIADSNNMLTETNTTEQSYSDSYNTDASKSDSGWTDDNSDNSDWVDDHHSDDNSVNNEDQYSGDTVNQ